MNATEQTTSAPPDTSLNDLSASLDESSRVNRNLGLAFVSLCIFLFVFNRSVEDVMILLPEMFRLQIPVVDLKVTLKGIYILTPLILVLFHYNLLQNLTHHDAKLELWSKAMLNKVREKFFLKQKEEKENNSTAAEHTAENKANGDLVKKAAEKQKYELLLQQIEEKEKYIYPFLYNYSILHREEICTPRFREIPDVAAKRAYLKECLNSRVLLQFFLFVLPLIVLGEMFLKVIRFGSSVLFYYYALLCIIYYFFIVIRFNRKLCLEKIDITIREEGEQKKWKIWYILNQLGRSVVPRRGRRYKVLRENWKKTYNNLPRLYNKWTFNWRIFAPAWANFMIMFIFFWNMFWGIMFLTKTSNWKQQRVFVYEGHMGFRYHLNISNERFESPALATDYFSYHFYAKKYLQGRVLRWSDFDNSILSDFNFTDVHFYRCRLDNTSFRGARFTHCKWTPASPFTERQYFNRCTFDQPSFKEFIENYNSPQLDTISIDNQKSTLLLNKRDTLIVNK